MISISEASVAQVPVRVDEPFDMDFGEGMIVIRRRTEAQPKPQYIFASNLQDGSWTTNGVSAR